MAAEQYGISVSIDAELARFEQAMRSAGRLTTTTATGMDRATKNAAKAFDRLEGAMDPASRALTRLDRDTMKVQRALDKGAISVDRAAEVQRRLNDQYEATVARLNGFTTAAANSNSAVEAGTRRLSAGVSRQRNFALAVQNTSYQVGDFAVQVAAGTDATRALAMQLPQLLGGFGVMGAVAGGVVAVLGALAPVLLSSGDAAESTASAQDVLSNSLAGQTSNVEELIDLYEDLTEAQANLEEISLLAAQKAEIREYEQAVKDLREGLSDMAGDKYWMDFDGRWTEDKLQGVNRVLDQLARRSIDVDEGIQQLELELRRSGVAAGFLDEKTLRLVSTLAKEGEEVADAEERLQRLQDILNGTGRAASDMAEAAPGIASFIDRAAQAEDAAPAMRQLAEAMRLVEGVKLTGEAVKLFSRGDITQEQFDSIYAAIDEFVEKGDAAFEKARQGPDKFARELERLKDELDPVGAATRAFEQDMQTLTRAGLANGEMADELVRRYGEDLTKAWEDVTGKVSKYAKEAEKAVAALEQENRLIQLRINGQDELADRLQYEARMREQLGPLYDQYADKLGEIYERNKRLTGQFEEQEAAIGYLENVGERAFDRIGSAITEAFTQGEGAAVSFGSIAQGILSELMQSFIELAAINPLKNALGMGGGGLPVIGDVIGSIAGGLFGAPAGTSSSMPINAGSLIPGYAAGGHHSGGLRLVGERGPEIEATGPARIWSADQTAKMLGGGAPKITINVHNNAGAEVSTQARTDGNGNVQIDQMIDRAVAKKANTRGSAINKALRMNYGADERLTRR